MHGEKMELCFVVTSGNVEAGSACSDIESDCVALFWFPGVVVVCKRADHGPLMSRPWKLKREG